MKCNTRRAKEDAVISAYQFIAKNILAFLDASAGCVVTDLCGYKRKRLQSMFDATQETISHFMDRYGEGLDACSERAEAANFTVKRRLKEYAKFDFDAATKEMLPEDNFGKTWHSQADIRKHGTRSQFIADMELVVHTYHGCILYWFWETYGFAHDRLTRLYRLLREDYNRWIAEYLKCTLAGDKKTQEMLAKRQDKMEALGMEFEEVYSDKG